MKKYYFILITALVFLGACEVKKPTMPSWSVKLNIPLINDFFYVSDLVDSVNIVLNEDNILTVTANGEATTNEFGNLPFNPNINLTGIPLIGSSYDFYIPFTDPTGTVEIAYAELAEGVFESRLRNVDPNVDQISLVFHDIYLPNSNQNLVISSDNFDNWVTTNLDGMHLGTPNTNEIITQLHISIQVNSTLPAGTQVATLDFRSDSMISLGEFRGGLHNYPVNLNDSDSSINIDYPHGLDQTLTLEEASLQLTLQNYIGFGAEFSGQLKATNAAGVSRIIDILDENGNNFQIQPALQDGPVVMNFNLYDNITELLQLMPTTIQVIGGCFEIESDNNIGSVKPTDTMHLDYLINAPLIFTLHEHEIVINEEHEFSIPEDNRERIQKNALSASLNMQIQNMLPIGASAKLFLSNTPNIDIHNPGTYSFLKQVEIHSFNQNPGFQDVELELTKDELDLFASEQVYMRWSFSFEETGSPVTIHASSGDYIHLKGMISAEILIEED
ncbi:MAG TPA: hypothetical protein PK928_01655 [Candidatus Cloacimonas sp.]|nr:hypothetical protein [Candidatus Cloacimonas sp.]